MGADEVVTSAVLLASKPHEFWSPSPKSICSLAEEPEVSRIGMRSLVLHGKRHGLVFSLLKLGKFRTLQPSWRSRVLESV